ncbi:MAG: helix-turn-helix transcriptional regulator [Psychromonas sp.]
MTELDKTPGIVLIKTTYVHTLLGMLRDIDPDIYPYIEQAGLPENILNTPYDYIPDVPVRQLIEIIAQKSSDAEYQNLCRQACKNIFIPTIIRQIKQARTVEQALLEFIEIMKTESPNSQISVQSALGKTWFARYKAKSVNGAKWYELSEQFAVIYMIELLRVITNTCWEPDILSLQSDEVTPFRTMLEDADMTSSQIYTGRNFTALNLSDEILAKTFNRQLSWQYQEQIVHQPKNFLESLKVALPTYLFAGKLPISKAASVIGLSVRTLQRRLKELDVSYRQILDEIQINEAKKLLKNSNHPITAISTHLGYSNVAHFSRAFKRVTGEAPSIFRQH